jgi:DNA-directed RNA polymerase subunit RPC12/RpoP
VKCFFHPAEDALYECSSCGKPICGQCMRFDDDDAVVCPACTLEKALDVADEDVSQFLRDRHRRIEEQRRERSALAHRLSLVNGWWIVAILLLALAQVTLRWYIGRASNPTEFDLARFRRAGDPGLEMSYVLSRVFAYGNERGVFPAALRDLTPRFLPAPPNILGSDEPYAYSRIDGPELFLINLPKADRWGYRRLYATDDGVLHVE